MKAAGDKVISIADRMAEAPPLTLIRKGWDECGHKHVVLNQELRNVTCADCGEDRVDAFEVLTHLAHEWERWEREFKSYRAEVNKYENQRRDQWRRARDRHLNAHSDHLLDFNRNGWSQGDGTCHTCFRLAHDTYAERPVGKMKQPPE